MNSYKEIDLNTWDRKQHFALFSQAQNPMYTVQFDLDVSRLCKTVKEKGLSFTLSMVYLTAECANQIENFRYRFVDKKPVIYEKIDTCFAYLDEQTKLFKFVNCDFEGTMEEFVKLAKISAENQHEYFVAPPKNDSFAFTCMPWVTFTAKTHTYGGNPYKASPTFDWGKFYTDRDGRIKMPFSAEVNHCFVDGYHIGLLADNLQQALDNI